MRCQSAWLGLVRQRSCARKFLFPHHMTALLFEVTPHMTRVEGVTLRWVSRNLLAFLALSRMATSVRLTASDSCVGSILVAGQCSTHYLTLAL